MVVLAIGREEKDLNLSQWATVFTQANRKLKSLGHHLYVAELLKVSAFPGRVHSFNCDTSAKEPNLYLALLL